MSILFSIIFLIALLDSIALLRQTDGTVFAPRVFLWALVICFAVLAVRGIGTMGVSVVMLLFCPVFYWSGNLLWSRIGMRPGVPSGPMWICFALLVLFPIVCSFLLSTMFPWRPMGASVPVPSFGDIVFIGVSAAFSEEMLFRHYLQGRIGQLCLHFKSFHKGCVFMMIAAPAILFASVHMGSLEPYWLKWLQIVLLGICLGIIRLRWGLWLAIAAHLLFNLSIILMV